MSHLASENDDGEKPLKVFMATLAGGRLAKDAPAMSLNEILREGHDYHEFRTWLCAMLANWIMHWERNNSRKFPHDDHPWIPDPSFMRLRGVSFLKSRKGSLSRP
jgi:hypothetical protein